MTVDIFKEGESMDYEWARIPNVGDSFQGTYIGSHEATDSFANEQVVYHFKQANGKLLYFGVRKVATGFHDRMSQCSPGQIIGVKHTEDVPSKNMPGKQIKIYSVFSNPNLIDEEWVKSQQRLKELKESVSDVEQETFAKKTKKQTEKDESDFFEELE